MTTASPRARVVLAMALVITIALGWCATVTVNQFIASTNSVRLLEFALSEVTWDPAGGRLAVVFTATNRSAAQLNLEEFGFSLYYGNDFVVTNPDARADKELPPGAGAHLTYSLAVDQYYSRNLPTAGPAANPWRARGRALVLIPGMRPKFPVSVNL